MQYTQLASVIRNFMVLPKERNTVDFVGKRKIFFAISIILILCGPVGMLVHSNVIGDKAMNYSLEFRAVRLPM